MKDDINAQRKEVKLFLIFQFYVQMNAIYINI